MYNMVFFSLACVYSQSLLHIVLMPAAGYGNFFSTRYACTIAICSLRHICTCDNCNKELCRQNQTKGPVFTMDIYHPLLDDKLKVYIVHYM